VIHAERRGTVSLVTIDRPARRNALDHESLTALAAAVRAAEDGGSRALVLTGAGDHFCAGADLTGVEDDGFAQALRAALHGLHDAPFPTIAAVHGAALGAGTQLAVACDLRVATADARFGIPAARLGLMVDHWTVRRLVRLAGEGPARAMLLTADVVNGDTAAGIGLVQRLGDLAAALEWADEISTLAPLTIAGHKVLLNRVDADLPDDPAVTDAFRRAWDSEDLQEGLAAFRDRRSPEFRGR
jgi:enoyl-CoA hydratase